MKELASFKDIFKDKIFKIPDYQRGYAWTTRQLKDFWEDVVNLPLDRHHYTGLLSLKMVSKEVWQSWNEERWLIEERGYKVLRFWDNEVLKNMDGVLQIIKGVLEKPSEYGGSISH